MSQFEQYLVSLDKYNVIKKIAEGSFASMLLIEDKEAHKQCVAKIFKSVSNDKEHILEMVEIMAQLHHSTLVKLVGYSPIDFNGCENLTIITEYASNGSLSELIKQNTLNNTQRQIILIGICDGVRFLHQQNYIHRDIKPSNIIIDENFHPQINDYFDIIKYTPGVLLDQSVGTKDYMAPEVFNDDGYGPQADVYSFAIVMLQIVTGNLQIYNFKEFHGLYHFLKCVSQGKRPEFTVPVKKSIKTLIEKCWSAKPSDRMTFDQLFQTLAYDPEYYLDDVDANAVKEYADSLRK